MRQGFTLIELSIVLVIIGLIIGGVLVGQDLIHAAEIRATVKQVETFDSTVNTFRLKYNCLPGDCAYADTLGFQSISYGGGGAAANGDGDGKISGNVEIFNALTHLSVSGLLSGVITQAVTNDPELNPKMMAVGVNSHKGVWIIAYMTATPSLAVPSLAPTGAHYYWANCIFICGDGAPVFTPIDTLAIDSKLDDGLPSSGRVLASGDVNGAIDTESSFVPLFDPVADIGPAGGNSDFCVTNDTPHLYNVQNTSRDAGSLCTMIVRASF